MLPGAFVPCITLFFCGNLSLVNTRLNNNRNRHPKQCLCGLLSVMHYTKGGKACLQCFGTSSRYRWVPKTEIVSYVLITRSIAYNTNFTNYCKCTTVHQLQQQRKIRQNQQQLQILKLQQLLQH